MNYGIAHGRFQPLHRQHLEYLLSVKNRCQHLVVGITNPFQSSRKIELSSPHRHLDDANPLSYFERQQIIADALLGSGLDPHCFSIVPFDLFQPQTWRDSLPDPSCCKFYVRVFSDWELEKIDLFGKNGFEFEIIDPGCEKQMTASEVRSLIREGNLVKWSSMVPPATVDAIKALERDI